MRNNMPNTRDRRPHRSQSRASLGTGTVVSLLWLWLHIPRKLCGLRAYVQAVGTAYVQTVGATRARRQRAIVKQQGWQISAEVHRTQPQRPNSQPNFSGAF
eukprot:467132-Amphidinium_carterae.1